MHATIQLLVVREDCVEMFINMNMIVGNIDCLERELQAGFSRGSPRLVAHCFVNSIISERNPPLYYCTLTLIAMLVH